MRLDIGQGLDRFERKNKIKLVVGQQFHQLIQLLIHDIDFYLRIQLHKRYHGFREYGAEGVCDTDIERTCQHVAQITDTVGTGLGIVNSAQGIREYRFSRLCQLYGMAVTDKKLCPQFIFQLSDLLRKRTLCYIQAGCRM